MGNNTPFESLEKDFPNLTEGKLINIIKVSEKTEIDAKQVVNWILRMVPILAAK